MHHLGETMIVNYFLRKIAKWFCVQEYLVVAWRCEQVISWYFRQDFWDHHHPFIDLACAWKRSWSVKVSFFLGFMNLLKKEIHCCQKSCPISWRSHACSFFAIVILRNPLPAEIIRFSFKFQYSRVVRSHVHFAKISKTKIKIVSKRRSKVRYLFFV